VLPLVVLTVVNVDLYCSTKHAHYRLAHPTVDNEFKNVNTVNQRRGISAVMDAVMATVLARVASSQLFSSLLASSIS